MAAMSVTRPPVNEGRLSTHVLDTARGRPAVGMVVDLLRLEADGTARPLKSVATNADGRTDEPLLAGAVLTAGRYRLVFHVGAYFAATGEIDGGVFLDRVPIDFLVADPAAKYHVPLLVSPWSYATYRGS
jgi:5-hydroxyisourate hydrolase